MKATIGAACVVQLTLGLKDRPWSDNLGGIGTPADKILYEMINEDTIDSEEGYKLSIQLYYKSRDYREVHGNLYLRMKNPPDMTNVRFGWLWTHDQ